MKGTTLFHFTILIFLVLSFTFNAKLVYLLEIARHGAKYPEKNVTSIVDPPSLLGQLTGVGMRQQYLLGSYLYHDYVANSTIFSGKLNARQI
jgi:hypothetical protein